ncbi:arylsulfotransferase family protein [Rhodospirillaceae bacterium SYSU D60014]|uniref:arylsulfotransferase family protein n=1 Tax=Virgifigura deserti TaxID=2268457 RepID=UPI0013C4B3B4
MEAVLNRIFSIIFMMAIGFLAFLGGSFVILARIFPYEQLNNAYHAGRALYVQKTQFAEAQATDLYAPARTTKRGSTIYERTRAQNGLTLYASSHDQRAFLISMEGEVVHEWHLPFSAVWDDTAAVKDPWPDSFVMWDDVYLYPNGDLLAIYVGIGDTPWGYGLVKMDKDSQVVWKYLARAHHDLDVAEDGTIYLLTHETRFDEIETAKHMAPPRVDDYVVLLSPDGEELKKVSVLDALVKSPYGRLLIRVPWYATGESRTGDFTHANAVDLIGAEAAANMPFATQGQVLLSLRELDMIVLLDLDREEIVWALRGPWLGQHDPDVLPNGNILLFDNAGHYDDGGESRVIEFDPETLQITWSYAGDAQHPFESIVRSGQDRLPNGNTLITESDGGRIFEVTPDGTIVWEYVNPVRGGTSDELIPVLSRATRIDPASLDPGFPPSQVSSN